MRHSALVIHPGSSIASNRVSLFGSNFWHYAQKEAFFHEIDHDYDDGTVSYVDADKPKWRFLETAAWGYFSLPLGSPYIPGFPAWQLTTSSFAAQGGLTMQNVLPFSTETVVPLASRTDFQAVFMQGLYRDLAFKDTGMSDFFRILVRVQSAPTDFTAPEAGTHVRVDRAVKPGENEQAFMGIVSSKIGKDADFVIFATTDSKVAASSTARENGFITLHTTAFISHDQTRQLQYHSELKLDTPSNLFRTKDLMFGSVTDTIPGGTNLVEFAFEEARSRKWLNNDAIALRNDVVRKLRAKLNDPQIESVQGCARVLQAVTLHHPRPCRYRKVDSTLHHYTSSSGRRPQRQGCCPQQWGSSAHSGSGPSRRKVATVKPPSPLLAALPDAGRAFFVQHK
ncbi:uncharacterized protein K452DRAFT_299780 [Aplosporella prunicola CBS 121167]|uniref:Uncharacterized protein n=1 Tax=Aplosporella prunicola CBS 121167 TaxID=1176127 RepID=A0A6A6B7B0_9PEZI|nr:uncharacterized protein K452DRAFT_299780 [Aplosporella prunicola CBS 121167]KAF2139786.1 hypothetical protein K452DRAFT_299780 [Aplosporella prunicola CBS 121167]